MNSPRERSNSALRSLIPVGLVLVPFVASILVIIWIGGFLIGPPKEGPPPEPTLKAYAEYSQIGIPEDAVNAEVVDTHNFFQRNDYYWVTYELPKASAEELCETLGGLRSGKPTEAKTERFGIPPDYVSEYEGDIRTCEKRLEHHRGKATIFYPGTVEETAEHELVTVYLQESENSR